MHLIMLCINLVCSFQWEVKLLWIKGSQLCFFLSFRGLFLSFLFWGYALCCWVRFVCFLVDFFFRVGLCCWLFLVFDFILCSVCDLWCFILFSVTHRAVEVSRRERSSVSLLVKQPPTASVTRTPDLNTSKTATLSPVMKVRSYFYFPATLTWNYII